MVFWWLWWSVALWNLNKEHASASVSRLRNRPGVSIPHCLCVTECGFLLGLYYKSSSQPHLHPISPIFRWTNLSMKDEAGEWEFFDYLTEERGIYFICFSSCRCHDIFALNYPAKQTRLIVVEMESRGESLCCCCWVYVAMVYGIYGESSCGKSRADLWRFALDYRGIPVTKFVRPKFDSQKSTTTEQNW